VVEVEVLCPWALRIEEVAKRHVMLDRRMETLDRLAVVDTGFGQEEHICV
jgi:hypothetical protein